MIQLKGFDYDIAELEVSANGEDFVIKIHSSFTTQAIKAGSFFKASTDAAKEQGVDLEVEIDNFGIKISESTDTFKKLYAQYAGSLVAEWPFEVDMIQELIDNETLCSAIINKSNKRGEEFLTKKSK